MGDFVITMGEQAVRNTIYTGDGRFDCILPYRTRPCKLRMLRIYECSVAIKNKEIADIVADALALERLNEVDSIIREFGLVGEWRPSSILTTIIHSTTSRVLATDVPAHALWNSNLDCVLAQNDMLSVVVSNATDAARRIRPVLHLYEESAMDYDMENELRRLTNAVADQSRAIAELQAATRKQSGTVSSNSLYDLGSFRSGWNNGDDY